MRRFFVKNLSFVLLVNLLVKPIWIFFIDRVVQNRVGHAEYGHYVALLNLTLVLQILLDFGLTNYNSKLVAQRPEALPQLFPSMLYARFFLALIYAAVVFGVGYALGYSDASIWLLFGILLFQSLNSLLLFIRSSLTGLHLFKYEAVLSAADKFLMILICGALLFLARKR